MRFSKVIAQNAKGCLVVSTDISSSNMHARVESRLSENIAPLVCDLRALPIRSNVADGVVVINVFHHLPTSVSLFDVINELRRICRESARMFVKENVSNNPVRSILEKVYWTLPASFFRRMEIIVDPYSKAQKLPRDYRLLRFSAEQLTSTLARYGFRVIAEERQELFLYFTYYVLKTVRPLTLLLNRVFPYTCYAYEVEQSFLKRYPFRKFCLSVSLEALPI
jgi:ubiquinone/menaquinone biosynthesis C-methylase UbiE